MSILERFRVDGKVAIVTGASSGIGVAIAEGLAEAGADIALGARRADKLAETAQLVEAHGRRAICVATDVTKPADCEALVAAAVEQLGRVDILINNAGMGKIVPAIRETPEEFQEVMDLNLNACLYMAQAAAKAMTEGGVIVNVASIMALRSFGQPQAAYTASKAGLIAMTADLAQQWTGRKGIRVNAISPGLVETDMTREYFRDKFHEQAPHIPMDRPGQPDEIAAATLFLASDASSYMTGANLIVDGGRLIL